MQALKRRLWGSTAEKCILHGFHHITIQVAGAAHLWLFIVGNKTKNYL